MKKIEFETSKGKFLVCDAVENANIHTGISLKEITEEQASEIVGIEINMNHSANHNIMQLHSILKSKGIHLFYNPYIFKIID